MAHFLSAAAHCDAHLHFCAQGGRCQGGSGSRVEGYPSSQGQLLGQPTAFGVNCETTEDDCTVDMNPCQYQPSTPTCVDCARYAPPPPGGFGQGPANPACAQGFTCEAAAAEPAAEPMPEPAVAGGSGSCASSPCQNSGVCTDSATDPTLHGDKYTCTCAVDPFGTPSFYGVNGNGISDIITDFQNK